MISEAIVLPRCHHPYGQSCERFEGHRRHTLLSTTTPADSASRPAIAEPILPVPRIAIRGVPFAPGLGCWLISVVDIHLLLGWLTRPSTTRLAPEYSRSPAPLIGPSSRPSRPRRRRLDQPSRDLGGHSNVRLSLTEDRESLWLAIKLESIQQICVLSCDLSADPRIDG